MNLSHAAALIACAAVLSPLSAQTTYPTRPVTLVVPYAAGGPTDVIARALAEKLAPALGQPVVVDNKPGANEAIAAAAVATAKPDGHTLFLGTDAALSLNQHLYDKLSYNAETDLVPVSRVATVDMLLVAPASLGIKGLPELVKAAKEAKTPLNYASAGVGNPNHLAMEWFATLAGVKLNHVPYRGITPALPDLFSNRVSLMFSGISTVLPHIQDGKLVPLAISGRQRASALPSVPTFAELGFANYEAGFYLGLAAPAGTPAPVLQRLAAEIKRATGQPDFRAKAQQNWGIAPVADTPEEFAAFLKRDRASAAHRVKISGARLEN
jgi:tripartite-type tricarboxylate transporter receptor subunit TctC